MAKQPGVRKKISSLMEFAKDASQDLANRYVSLSRKLSSRKRVSMREYNRVACRKCNAYFTSKTSRVRTRKAHVVYTCLSCGHITRVPRATRRSSQAEPRTV